MDFLIDFWIKQSRWSQATFGKDSERGPAGPLDHLAKEVEEAKANPKDIYEYVDMFFLVIDATRRAGFDPNRFMNACWNKLAINKARKWPKPTDPNKAVEHERDIVTELTLERKLLNESIAKYETLEKAAREVVPYFDTGLTTGWRPHVEALRAILAHHSSEEI